MSTKSYQISVRVEDALARKLKKLAAKDRRNLADYVRLALEDHVKNKRVK